MTADQYNLSVDKFSDNIYRFVRKGLKDPDKAKDVVQETYERLWLKHEGVQFEKVKSYLFTTAYHAMVDTMRIDARSASINEVDMREHMHTTQFTDLNTVLHLALNRLPEIQRSVVLLRDYEGYSYEEISEITGLTESQVKVYIFRARTFLRKYIVSLEKVI
jgi:RNA polymerase sigma factor (sigma-70 family)